MVHLDSVATRMGTDATEIHPESRLHKRAHGIRQWAAATFALIDPEFNTISSLKAIEQ
jgi:hypothetical protein